MSVLIVPEIVTVPAAVVTVHGLPMTCIVPISHASALWFAVILLSEIVTGRLEIDPQSSQNPKLAVISSGVA